MARLLYLVSEDWYFLSPRLPMARAARQAGYEVHVATRISSGAEGFELHPLTWRRGSRNPATLIKDILSVRRLYRSLAPELFHQVALWPSIVGSLAAFGLPMQRLSAPAGLGFAFTSNSFQARFVRTALRPLLRHLFGGPHSAVLVQNPDDDAAMAVIGISRSRLFIIPGSITAAYVGRLLADIGTVQPDRCAGAADHPRATHSPSDCQRSRSSQSRIHSAAGDRRLAEARWHRASRPCARYQLSLGRGAYRAVLPSRREGLPMSLLEAAACGQPIMATDVPGNREIAKPDVTALLVSVDDEAALADAWQNSRRMPICALYRKLLPH
jgi:Glycosyl transferases group 1/Glycosyl transferase 4-like